MSRTWRTRPSQLLHLASDSWGAYCVDEAVYLWGSKIDAELEKAGMDPKDLTDSKRLAAVRRREAVLERYLGDWDIGDKPVPKGVFRDPSTMFGK